jgi:hypothetical protein
MAGVTGLEPAASGVTGRRSNQLSYTPAACAPRRGLLTPPSLGVKLARPCKHMLNGNPQMVGDEGFEPPTPSV